MIKTRFLKFQNPCKSKWPFIYETKCPNNRNFSTLDKELVDEIADSIKVLPCILRRSFRIRRSDDCKEWKFYVECSHCDLKGKEEKSSNAKLQISPDNWHLLVQTLRTLWFHKYSTVNTKIKLLGTIANWFIHLPNNSLFLSQSSWACEIVCSSLINESEKIRNYCRYLYLNKQTPFKFFKVWSRTELEIYKKSDWKGFMWRWRNAANNNQKCQWHIGRLFRSSR